MVVSSPTLEVFKYRLSSAFPGNLYIRPKYQRDLDFHQWLALSKGFCVSEEVGIIFEQMVG